MWRVDTRTHCDSVLLFVFSVQGCHFYLLVSYYIDFEGLFVESPAVGVVGAERGGKAGGVAGGGRHGSVKREKQI